MSTRFRFKTSYQNYPFCIYYSVSVAQTLGKSLSDRVLVLSGVMLTWEGDFINPHKIPVSMRLCTLFRCSFASPNHTNPSLDNVLYLSSLTTSLSLAMTIIRIPRDLAFWAAARVRFQFGGSRDVNNRITFVTSGSLRPLV